MDEKEPQLPEKFKSRIEKQLGSEAPSFFQSFYEEPHRALRINPLKCDDPASLLDYLGLDPAKQVPWEPNGYEYEEELAPGKHPLHAAGAYYIQEPSAMLPVSMLRPAKEDRVLDLCASPGGKTTQLAAYMENRGLLIANEIHPARARILSENVERMGLKNCIVLNEKPEALAKRFPGFFTKILVDAPCSGEGMFRRNYTAIEEWEKGDRNGECQERQKLVLKYSAQMLQEGGILCYSTCTFAEEENEIVVKDFLEQHHDFHFGNIRRIWPHRDPGEGHFSCLLYRDKTNFEGQNLSSNLPKLNHNISDFSKSDRSLQKFSKSNPILTRFFEDLFSDPNLLPARFITYGDTFYLLPEGAPKLDGLRALRPGLCLGTIKKGSSNSTFLPSHALALSLSPEQVNRSLSLSLEEARRYLHGEALPTQGSPGWTLVHLNGYSLGFGKVSNGMLKNHYPKGLRI